MPTRRILSAFTMMELVVAMAATMIMVLFLNQIFTSLSSGVSVGRATSDVIQSNLAFSKQIGDDAHLMVGPLQRGFLMILQKEYRNQAVGPFPPQYQGKLPNNYPSLKLRANDPTSRFIRVRSDQLMFVRPTAGLVPRTPASPDVFEDAVSGAGVVRIWYGHVTLTDTNGLAAVSPPPYSPPPPFPPVNGDSRPGGPRNVPALNWVLGRQAMFLDENIALAPYINWTALGPGRVTDYPDQDTEGNEIPEELWFGGISDILKASLATLLPTPPPNDPFSYIKLISFRADRLWCNPEPPSSRPAHAWRTAQFHPYFLGNVSHFQVDFAGDYLRQFDTDGSLLIPPLVGQDGQIDVDTNTGGIKWYSGILGTNPDGKINAETDLVAADNTTATPFDSRTTAATAKPFYHFVAGTAPGDPADQWAPDSGDLATNATVEFTWGPTGYPGALLWPHLIRIRYRLHDKAGKIADADGQPGKLFERIIRVRDLFSNFNPE